MCGIFDYISSEFHSTKQMNEEKIKLMNEMCKHFGLKRKEFRLSRGMLKLQGEYKGDWINLTSVITDFNEVINRGSCSNFRLRVRVAKK